MAVKRISVSINGDLSCTATNTTNFAHGAACFIFADGAHCCSVLL